MTTRIQKQEIIRRVAQRTATDEKIVAAQLDAILDTLYEAFKAEESVTLTGFGSFYVRAGRESWTFKFNPGQKLRALFGWSSSYIGEL